MALLHKTSENCKEKNLCDVKSIGEESRFSQ